MLAGFCIIILPAFVPPHHARKLFNDYSPRRRHPEVPRFRQSDEGLP